MHRDGGGWEVKGIVSFGLIIYLIIVLPKVVFTLFVLITLN